jgi:hypothetical protein
LSSREEIYLRLTEIALRHFHDIITGSETVDGKLRLMVTDGSYIDVWLSEKRKGTYAYHWERRGIDGTIYRHNNLPDPDARVLRTFPKHFHDGSEQNLAESAISSIPEEALHDFLGFVRRKIA